MIKFLIINVIIYLIPSFIFAQQKYNPDILKMSIAGQDGYKSRQHDERYEGMYEKFYGAERLKIVSLLNGELDYSLSEKEKIVFKHPKIANLKDIGVTGSSFGLDKYYQLDFVLTTNKLVTIPLRDVITKQFIYAENLGILGYIGSANSPSLYIPLNVQKDKRFTDQSGKSYNLILLGNATITAVNWKFAIVNGSTHSDYTNGGEIQGYYPDRQGIRITLDFPEKVKIGDTVLVEVYAVPEGQKKSSRFLSFNMLITP